MLNASLLGLVVLMIGFAASRACIMVHFTASFWWNSGAVWRICLVDFVGAFVWQFGDFPEGD